MPAHWALLDLVLVCHGRPSRRLPDQFVTFPIFRVANAAYGARRCSTRPHMPRSARSRVLGVAHQVADMCRASTVGSHGISRRTCAQACPCRVTASAAKSPDPTRHTLKPEGLRPPSDRSGAVRLDPYVLAPCISSTEGDSTPGLSRLAKRPRSLLAGDATGSAAGHAVSMSAPFSVLRIGFEQ